MSSLCKQQPNLQFQHSTPPTTAMQRRFRRGDLVEVASVEEGFVGSYYEATIVTDLVMMNEYIVQYKTLLKEDLSGPLREVATAAEVRPRPPKIPPPANEFRLYDVVDAFDNDGWWAGKITGRTGDGRYYVFFETTGDELPYPKDTLRVHQDWVNGNWVS
ncbi:hypothetical protein ABFS82_13G065400 [Erythranthe guttata]